MSKPAFLIHVCKNKDTGKLCIPRMQNAINQSPVFIASVNRNTVMGYTTIGQYTVD